MQVSQHKDPSTTIHQHQAPKSTPPNMNNTPDEMAVRLQIWQEILNKSSTTQHCILSSPFMAKSFDIVDLQEPYMTP
jgi:hypothetical protein